MEAAAENPYLTAKNKYENAAGTGLFFDSDFDNPYFYSLCCNMLTCGGKADLQSFLTEYSKLRYGTDAFAQTLLRLQKLCFGKGSALNQASALCARPGGDIEHTALYDTFERPYKNL